MRDTVNTKAIIVAAGLVTSLLWAGGDVFGQGKKGLAPEAYKNVGAVLAKAFNAEPFSPPMPDHIWMDVGDSRMLFLHFSKPVTDPAANLIFVGEALKGRFCAEEQPEAGKTGFVHFHRSTTPKDATGMAAHGHGGRAGEEGYWLKHIAVSEFDMMGVHFTPGLTTNFMPTPAPRCG